MASSSVRAQRVSNVSQRFLETWASLQVEFQGCYSPQRLLQLQSYSAGLGSLRLVMLCVLTPLSFLFLSLLGDVVSLPPLEAGASRNWFVFARGWALTGFIGASVLVQIGQGVSQLRMTARQVISISFLAATVAIASVALASSLTVFPLPFGALFAGPPCVIVIGTNLGIDWKLIQHCELN
ncbi:hypothetical protein PHYSODRAFT_325716 [Phytophthora sojae]|uniref:Uncharacterized protein n=1 Tax=Phytophthora sojae (strain P6497) TaxID=1094619 RepID=G4YZD8_PHYSP|nr:hypothetical protein PHYSODRAFT_325716 [Phytophthora sojae]EGZ24613.1 hypothetical protein PHYSODRAFT_325716 [Phytophthora sojae]|eukprot:XP_009519901.1 hypothetical protein PHYSODRAFT_325716 [Phytophthora sojae]